MSDSSNISAFPSEQHETLDGSWNQTFQSGMLLRDWFAGQTLRGLIGSSSWRDGTGAIPAEVVTLWTSGAYQVADAMLLARGEG